MEIYLNTKQIFNWNTILVFFFARLAMELYQMLRGGDETD